MKVIFLDFDGVITTEKSQWCLDPAKMLLLKQIVDATDAYIVISSSWRRGTLQATLDFIVSPDNHYVRGNPFILVDRVIGITGRLYLHICGEEDVYWKACRGESIQCYLDRNPKITNYLILDDIPNMLLQQKDNFIQTDATKGLSSKDVKRAINILNKEN